MGLFEQVCNAAADAGEDVADGVETVVNGVASGARAAADQAAAGAQRGADRAMAAIEQAAASVGAALDQALVAGAHEAVAGWRVNRVQVASLLTIVSTAVCGGLPWGTGVGLDAAHRNLIQGLILSVDLVINAIERPGSASQRDESGSTADETQALHQTRSILRRLSRAGVTAEQWLQAAAEIAALAARLPGAVSAPPPSAATAADPAWVTTTLARQQVSLFRVSRALRSSRLAGPATHRAAMALDRLQVRVASSGQSMALRRPPVAARASPAPGAVSLRPIR